MIDQEYKAALLDVLRVLAERLIGYHAASDLLAPLASKEASEEPETEEHE